MTKLSKLDEFRDQLVELQPNIPPSNRSKLSAEDRQNCLNPKVDICFNRIVNKKLEMTWVTLDVVVLSSDLDDYGDGMFFIDLDKAVSDWTSANWGRTKQELDDDPDELWSFDEIDIPTVAEQNEILEECRVLMDAEFQSKWKSKLAAKRAGYTREI